MKKIPLIVWICVVLTCIVALYATVRKPRVVNRCNVVTIREFSICTSVARTPEELEKGLSGTPPLSETDGMLFIFAKPDTYGFWMKDMSYPIDIVWIDESYRIVDIDRNVSPKSYPEVFRPSAPVSFVFETKAGNADTFLWAVGDEVRMALEQPL